jgi:hypothetical protein
MLSNDQMFVEQRRKNMAKDYVEGPIYFGPTYKIKSKTDTYIVRKDRQPGWTDRIMYATHYNSS